MKKTTFGAFTLVELIVVITIVGILSTVGFVSYSGYLTGARDSNRISQVTKLSDSLQVYSASKTLPLPDDYIEITASGSLIAYQGDVGVDVLETIDYTNGGKDPKDDTYYTYYLTKDRTSLQLMAMMEEQSSTAFNLTDITRAVNYEERYPKVYGRKLGALTYSDSANTDLTNTPAQEITANAGGLDIVTTPVNYTSHISDATIDKITGTGASLVFVNPKASCKRIKQTGGAGDNGKYTISPVGTDINVYCDMETNGGGWTMVARSSTAGGDMFSLSLNSLYPYTDYDNAYSIDMSDIKYSDAMLVSFTTNLSSLDDTLEDTLDESTMEVGTTYTLFPDGINGGVADDGFFGKQGAIFIK